MHRHWHIAEHEAAVDTFLIVRFGGSKGKRKDDEKKCLKMTSIYLYMTPGGVSNHQERPSLGIADTSGVTEANSNFFDDLCYFIMHLPLKIP